MQGISCGSLVSGVIGARKPVYDIWGNTVNVASRMDSTGKDGYIQAPAETAMLLKARGYTCTVRVIKKILFKHSSIQEIIVI